MRIGIFKGVGQGLFQSRKPLLKSQERIIPDGERGPIYRLSDEVLTPTTITG